MICSEPAPSARRHSSRVSAHEILLLTDCEHPAVRGGVSERLKTQTRTRSERHNGWCFRPAVPLKQSPGMRLHAYGPH